MGMDGASPTAPVAAPPGYLDQARNLAATVPANLLAVLTDELNRSGPAGAIEVCREKAPQMARAASERSGWNVRRASLRNRNPKGVPDVWERAALERFDTQAAAGAAAPTLERSVHDDRPSFPGSPVQGVNQCKRNDLLVPGAAHRHRPPVTVHDRQAVVLVDL